MLLIECSEIKKYFGDRLILNIDNLKVYYDDRIGIVGLNGSGKTTLINILSQRSDPDEGWVKLNGKAGYMSQTEAPDSKFISGEMASKLGVKTIWNENMSGGEKTRFKLAGALENESSILFADEPTSNLDIDGIEIMEEEFLEYNGALIIISHDRSFLDKLCSKILEVENGSIKIYNGNYSDYKEQKTLERERAQFEYDEYVNEKKRLERVVIDTKQKAKNIKKAPKRMGNSEARLHKMGGQKAKKNLDKKVKNAVKRIEHLELKEKPTVQSKIKIDISDANKLHNKIIIEGKKINKKFESKIIFNNAEFNIYNGTKTALIGPNGCGKSTLIKMIINNEDSIKIAHGAKIGYFSQDMSILNNSLSIIDNVMENSPYPESFARLLLARLLFKGDSIYKRVDLLSGGEQVKISFAKILLQDINMLILDEPTNYLDIYSLEAIEETLKEYGKTLLVVSHDRRFIDSIVNQVMVIENHKIKLFTCTYAEYMEKISSKPNIGDIRQEIILLESRLSEIVGKLSMQLKKEDMEALDKEYYETIDKLKRLKSN
jgi:macrolide transport system ATP-binding/permease protein